MSTRKRALEILERKLVIELEDTANLGESVNLVHGFCTLPDRLYCDPAELCKICQPEVVDDLCLLTGNPCSEDSPCLMCSIEDDMGGDKL